MGTGYKNRMVIEVVEVAVFRRRQQPWQRELADCWKQSKAMEKDRISVDG